ncbi:MAG: c-type cytochrome [bacterium]|nr:c-type cytochrome [bacterium]
MSVRTKITFAIIIVLIVAAIPVALIAKSRVTKSPKPRVHPIQNMDNQPRFKSQMYTAMFADRRVMRPPVPGTVARGEMVVDDAFHTGVENGEWVTGYPLPVTDALIQRGRERYTINCAPCHGQSGYGDGMVNKRAEELQQPTWIQPTSYHTDDIRNRPNGHIFNTITNGIRNMPGYGDKLTPHDRWAVVAYVRALQRSQHATLDDVPAEYLNSQP